jgi:D-alanyl-D-alanine carboxypeptidase
MDRKALDRALRYVASWLGYRHPTADVPGYAVAVSHRGRVLLDEAWGRGLRSGDPFRIASHSKSFTATAVLQLAEAGRLRLDDPVVGHVPWLAEHPDPRFGALTVRQLLCHGAGVIRDGLDADYWQLARPFPDAGQFRRELLDAELVTDANVALKYSNFGYTLLGLVVEAAAGRPYHDYVRGHILDPLRLSGTGPDVGAGVPARLVTGHGRRAAGGTRPALPVVDTRAMAPATGFYGTAADLCRFFSAHFVGSGKLLSDESKREMQRVHWHARVPGVEHVDVDYALGLILERIGERRTFGHSGGFPGHITKTAADPADGLVVCVLTNCIDGPARDMLHGIYKAIDFFQRFSGQALSRRLRRFEGRYLNLWSSYDLVAAGEGAVLASPDTWSPFSEPDRLEVLDATTLRIADTSSFGSQGELVRFSLRDGVVVSGTVAGTTVWPEARWPAAERRLLAGRRRPG